MSFFKKIKLIILFFVVSATPVLVSEVIEQSDSTEVSGPKFVGFDKQILTMFGAGLSKDPADIQEIVKYYKSLHLLSEEIRELQTSRSEPFLDPVEGVVVLDDEEEARQAQHLIEKMKREMKPNMLKELHAKIQKIPAAFLPKIKNIIDRILAHEVQEVREGKSLFKEFIHLSTDKIDDWLASFKKLAAVDLLTRELRVLFMGLKKHLPRGDQLFLEMRIPEPLEQVNQPEEQQ
jgi:hypothetical protein